MKRKSLAIVLALAVLLPVLAGCGRIVSGPRPDADQIHEAYEKAALETATTPTDVELKPGEVRYSGHSSADNIASIAVSFILSADKSTIHHFSLTVNGFEGVGQFDGGSTTVRVSGMNTTLLTDAAVDYAADNQNIPIGDHTIESLKFSDDGSAELVFTYLYKSDSDPFFEIAVPGIQFAMTSST